MDNVLNNKWVRQIIELQHKDGSWGPFHSLSRTVSHPISMEQALRRLYILGLTKEHEPIERALGYMRNCLLSLCRTGYREKALNWDAFERHMMSSWIRIFDPEDSLATDVAKMWKQIIEYSFKEGAFDNNAYAIEYRKYIPELHKGERPIPISQFYMINLLKGLLTPQTESCFLDYIIDFPTGIYYVNNSRIKELPEVFASKQTSLYLSAVEQLNGYGCVKEKLGFVKNWLLHNKSDGNEWDLGPSVKDGIYFPISESWRNPTVRKRDCTARIERIITSLS